MFEISIASRVPDTAAKGAGRQQKGCCCCAPLHHRKCSQAPALLRSSVTICASQLTEIWADPNNNNLLAVSCAAVLALITGTVGTAVFHSCVHFCREQTSSDAADLPEGRAGSCMLYEGTREAEQ